MDPDLTEIHRLEAESRKRLEHNNALYQAGANARATSIVAYLRKEAQELRMIAAGMDEPALIYAQIDAYDIACDVIERNGDLE